MVLLGLRRAGVLKISKSGKALEFVDQHRPIGNYFFYASLTQVKELLAGKRVSVDVALLVGDHRENL